MWFPHVAGVQNAPADLKKFCPSVKKKTFSTLSARLRHADGTLKRVCAAGKTLELPTARYLRTEIAAA